MQTLVRNLMVCLVAVTLCASAYSQTGGTQADLDRDVTEAERIVVARVAEVEPSFVINEWGDQLIVSNAHLQIEETLKGRHEESLTMTIEGGTIGDLTLDVSDMPRIEKGERAVLFLDSTPSGENVPHDRGNGVLKLDAQDRVPERGLTLAEIMRTVGAQKLEP